MPDLWMPGAERQPQGGGVTLNRALPARATWHITWDALTNGVQPAFDNVANYLKNQGYCPHLMWDPWSGRIVQFYPADVGGRALNAWNEDGAAHVQIETFFSPGTVRGGTTYATVADTPCKGLPEILAWLDTLGIPRVWPMGAPQWQGNSRDAGIWNASAGHYGHCNVPDNTHTDPGPMPSLTTLGAAAGTIDTIQEDDMPITDADVSRISAATVALIMTEKKNGNTLGEVISETRGHAMDIIKAVERVPGTIFDTVETGVAGDRITLRQFLREYRAHIIQMASGIAAEKAAAGATVEEIRQAVADELSAGIKVDATVTVGGAANG